MGEGSIDFQVANAESFSELDSQNQKIIDDGIHQQEILKELEEELKSFNKTMKNIEEEGDYYFTGNRMVIQYKEHSQSVNTLSNERSLKEVAMKLKKKDPDDILIKPVKYSNKELVKMQNDFKKYANQLDINEKYRLELNEETNQLDLKIISENLLLWLFNNFLTFKSKI
ncbi:hypothetical protein [Bacillus sp. FJAT-42315]|uniref:hypothetical protein n=1 Tax=Bacillus sp. FJAT-42315 TaxID=2014077 RepID=UPI000C232898|nr:hypothetical protein [Bacillus sp. FJAT-42315]